MTASVLENEFLLEELRDIQKIEAVWEDETTKTIVSVLCMPSLKGSVKRLIEKHVDGSRAGNAYLFVNSVEFIQQMVKACNLDDSNTRVIYSLNNNTEVGIKKGSPNDESKKINFITSTAFEGADFYDENGITYIISDNSKPHTLADISTSVIQIAGRIRNTKYDDFLFHIYTPTKYNVEVNYNEFKKSIYESIAKTKRIVREINDLSKESKRHVSLAPNEIFVTREENNDDYKYDPNIPKLHLYNYKLTRCIYRSRSELSREYRKYGFNVELQNNKAEPIPRMDLVKGKSFKEVCEALEKCWDNNFLKYTMLAAAQEKHPFINEAIHKLGFDGIKECSFIKQRVESKLISISHIGLEAKIADMFLKLNPAGTGDFISSFKAKKLLGVIYKELNIDKKPKSSQLNLCFDLKTDVIKDEKGKSVKGFRFLSEKALYSKVG